MTSTPPRRTLAGWVALGGAIGTGARLAVDALVGTPAAGWHAGIAVANVTGAFVLGLVALWPWSHRRAHQARAFAGTGAMGAYTTFSALTLAVVDGSPSAAVLLGWAASLVGGLAAAWLGLRLGLAVRRARDEPDQARPGEPDPQDPRRFEEEL